MSGQPSTSFDDVVRALTIRPGLPLPARTRLLRELRSDLDGMSRRLVEAGVAPDEARRRAAETLLPDDVTLSALERMVTPWYRRVTASMDRAELIRAERTALVLATLGILGLEASALVGAGLLADPSPFLWPVLWLGAVLLAGVAGKAFELWVKGAHERPRRGLTAIATLSALTLGTGCVGALLDLTVVARTLERAPDAAVVLTTRWLVQDAALVSTAIILSVAGGLGWFALSRWITHAEHAHGEASTPPASTDRAIEGRDHTTTPGLASPCS